MALLSGKLTKKLVEDLGPGRHGDGNGLSLVVDPSGARRWIVRVTVKGQRNRKGGPLRTDFGLGGADVVMLHQARERALEYRRMAKQGLNPRFNAEREIPTFEEIAQQVHIERMPPWKNAKHGQQWINTLRDYAFPKIGRMPVDSVGQPEVLMCLSPIWTDKHETARRLAQRLAAYAGDVVLGAGLETASASSFTQASGLLQSGTANIRSFEASYLTSALAAGGEVSILGGGSIIGQAAQIAATGDIALRAGAGDLVLGSLTDLNIAYEHRDGAILSGFMDFASTTESVSAVARDGLVESGGDIELSAGGNLAIEGGRFAAGGAFATDVGGETLLLASVDTEFSSVATHENNAILVVDTTDVTVSQEANFPEITAAGGVSFDDASAITIGLVGEQAALGTMAQNLVGIDDPEDRGETLALLDHYLPDPTASPGPAEDPLASTLASLSEAQSAVTETETETETSGGLFGRLFPADDVADPYDYSQSLIEIGLPSAEDGAGFAYLDDLGLRDNLTVEEMALVAHVFHDEQVELGVVSQLVLSYLVGTVTGGLGLTSLLQTVASTAMTGLIEGVVTGDLDLGQLLFETLVAGVTAGLTDAIDLGAALELSTDGLLREGGQLSLSSIADAFGDAAISSGINHVAYGTDLGAGLLSGFGSGVVGLATADVQTLVGDVFAGGANGGEGSIGHVALHSLVGCVSAELQGGACLAGAAGGAVAALFSGAMAESDLASEAQQGLVTEATLLSGLAASLFSQGDGTTAAIAGGIGGSAYQNNYLTHENLAQMQADLAACKAESDGCSDDEVAELREKYWRISRQNDLKVSLCTSVDCVDALMDDAASIGEVESFASANGLGEAWAIESGQIYQVALDLAAERIDFATGYEDYSKEQCEGLSRDACMAAYDQEYQDFLSDAATAEAFQYLFAGATGGAVATSALVGLTGPKMLALLELVEFTACIADEGPCLPVKGPTPSGKADEVVDALSDAERALDDVAEGAVDATKAGLPNVPGRVQSRVNLATGDRSSGWTHVLDSHFNPDKNASQFTVSQSELRTTLQSPDVVNTPVMRTLESADHGTLYVREVDLGRPIGTDKFNSFQPTSTMTVMTDRFGNLVTATPGAVP